MRPAISGRSSRRWPSAAVPGNGPARSGPSWLPGNRAAEPDRARPAGIILQLGNQLIINSPAQDQQRIADNDRDRTTYEHLPRDRYRETITRPNGVRIVTIYNRNGDILQRSRFDAGRPRNVLAYFDERSMTTTC